MKAKAANTSLIKKTQSTSPALQQQG